MEENACVTKVYKRGKEKQKIIEDKENVLTVPVEAISSKGEKHFVTLENGEECEVEVGIYNEEVPAVYSIKWIVISLVVSLLIGVAFGLFPAYKASKMDPIKALRTN